MPRYIEVIFESRNGEIVQDKINDTSNDNDNETDDNDNETDAGSNQTDAESENEEVGIIKNVNTNYVGNIRFEINPPEHCVTASAYLEENAAEVINKVCESDKLQYEDTYHVFLSCYSLYNRELDGTVQKSFATHCTNYIEIKGYTERITKEILDLLLKDLQHREEHVENIMSGSGWTYIKTTSIDLTYSRVLGRRVQKVQNKRNSLANYVSYPTGRRGGDYIINPNPKSFPARFDQHPGP